MIVGSWVANRAMYIRVMNVLKNFDFFSWHAMRGSLMLPYSISEEKLKIGLEQPAPEWPGL